MTFEQLFPDFVASCAQLHQAFMPAAMALLVVSFAFLFWGGPPQPVDWIRHLTKLFLIVLLLVHSHSLINDAQQILQGFVHRHVPARPENIATRYKERLAQAQGSDAGESWWDMVFKSGLFEAIVYAILVLISWLAMATLFYISILQQGLLLLYWVLSALLFPCFAIPPVAGLAMRHLLRILGVLSWPLGLALAATITDGLLGNQTDLGFYGNSALGKSAYVFTNLLSIAAIALWILFSTVLAPVLIQRLLTGGSGAASLIPRAATSLAGGLAMAVSAATGFFSGPAPRPARRNDADSAAPPLLTPDPPPGGPPESPSIRSFNDQDPTLENAVQETLAKPFNRYRP
ncbi:MAG: hypothetical protein IPK15_13380 [Verrucomicrobia bacterium]|nr:hypothetical protein [Verrucomicrobiota bacterium]